MSEQLSLADLSLRQVEGLPPVMQWRKLLARVRPPAGVSKAALVGVGGSLALHADREGGSCWPSLATIMDESGCSKRTVLRALLVLEQLGMLHRRRRGGHAPTSYTLLLPQPVDNLVDNAVDGIALGARSDSSRCQESTTRSALRSAQGQGLVAEGG